MITRGLLLLARGRAEGIREFGNTAEAVGASLAPLIAFPLVTFGITALHGQLKLAALGFLARLCGVLALPLITFEAARLARRQAFWARTVAATNWAFWPMLALAVAVETGLALGNVPLAAAGCALLLLAFCLLWYQWFIIRAGLGLRGLPAALLVLLNDAAVVLLSAAPLLLSHWLHVTIA